MTEMTQANTHSALSRFHALSCIASCRFLHFHVPHTAHIGGIFKLVSILVPCYDYIITKRSVALVRGLHHYHRRTKVLVGANMKYPPVAVRHSQVGLGIAPCGTPHRHLITPSSHLITRLHLAPIPIMRILRR